MSAQGKKKDKSFITLLVLIIVCACLMVAAVTTLGIGMSNGDVGDEGPAQSGEATEGTKWSSGTGAPAGDMGVVGDFYLDTVTGKIYKKTANGWELQITIPVASAVTPFINDDGYWQVGDTVYDGATAAGSLTEALIPQIHSDGYWYINGVKQEQFGRAWHDFTIDENGHMIMDDTADLGAIAPHIGDPDNGENDGYWYIGDVCTGYKASVDIEVKDGKFYIDGVLVPSVTAVDGYTPFINEDGNWQIGDNDTGIPARGQDGENGATPELGSDGNWYLNGEKIGPATGADGNYWHTGSGRPTLDAEETEIDGEDTFLVTGEVHEGDFFLNTLTGDVYRYLNEKWEKLCSISFRLTGNEWTINGKHSGIFVAQWRIGSGNPDNVEPGYKNDYYFDTATGNIYINVSEDADLGTNHKGYKWKPVMSLATGNWLTGHGTPEVALGGVQPLQGNLYLDLDNGQMYEYDGAESKWQRLEGFNLKGGQGDRSPILFAGKGAPNNTNTKGAYYGDYYLDTQSGIIYVAAQQADGTIDWQRSALNNDWISGAGDPNDNTDLAAIAVEGDVYYDTDKNALWQYSETTEKWTLLGRLAGATKWFHGSYDPAEIAGGTAEDEDEALFGALTADAIEGDFYLQTFSDFSALTGMKIYVYQGGSWVMLVDITKTNDSSTFNIPTLDALRDFRKSVADGKDFTGETVHLTGIVTMPDGDFAPIDDKGTFKGTFDGTGYYIQNLQGTLFGNLKGATIQNLDLRGVLDEKALATFFAADSTHSYTSLLTNTYGLAESIDGTTTIKDVKLTLSNLNGTVTVEWDADSNVTVTVTGNLDESKNNKLTIGSPLAAAAEGTTPEKIGLLELGAASFTFENVNFAGKSYLDVTNAKSLTLIHCEAQVAPVKAATRNADGTLSEGAANASEYAAFIVNKADAEGSLKLTIKDTTILAAQSQQKDGTEDNANSAAIYLTMNVVDPKLTFNLIGSSTSQYTSNAIVLESVSGEAFIDGNAVYGTNEKGNFTAFELGGTEAYTAKFYYNPVRGTKAADSENIYEFLSVKGTGKAQVYLMGETNTLTGAEDLFHSVTVADSALGFVAFNAAINDTSKLTSGYVYLGKDFNDANALKTTTLGDNVASDNADDVWIIDTAYVQPLAFVQHVADCDTTYYINNVTGLGYFRTSVNGVAAAAGVTPVEAKNYNAKTVILTDDITIPADTDTEKWTSIGTYDAETTTASKPFSGTFDGSGKTITGLKVALFGNLGAGATVKNLKIDNAAVWGEKYVSALAAVATGAVEITDVNVAHTTITLTPPSSGASESNAHAVGFFVGATDSAVTLNGVSVSEGNVAADSTLDNQYKEETAANVLLAYNYGLVGSLLTANTPATVTYGRVTSTSSVNIELANSDLTLLAVWAADDAKMPSAVFYTVASALGLNNVAKMVGLNDGTETFTFKGATVVLGDNIDMAEEKAWKGIGTETVAFEGTFAGTLLDTEGKQPVVGNHQITHLQGALFNNLAGSVQYLGLNEQALSANGAIAAKTTGDKVTIDNVTVTASWAQKVGEVSTVEANAFAAAPFNLIGEGSAEITSTTLTANLYPDKNGAFTLNIDIKIGDDKNNKNVTAVFTGSGSPDSKDATTYAAEIKAQHLNLKGYDGATAEFTFKNIKFSGDSYIYVGDALSGAVTALTVENCYAEVNPTQYTAQTVGHAAFIVGSAQDGADGSKNTVFSIKNNTIISGQSKDGETVNDLNSLAIFTWVGFADGTEISNNVFGSATRPYTSAVIKTLGFKPFASSDVTISNNTFYQVYGTDTELLEAVDLAPIAVTSDITYNVWFKGNTQIVTADKGVTADKITFVEVHNHLNAAVGEAGQPIYPVHGRVYITDDNTVTLNGEAVTVDYNFVNRSLLKTTFDYVGYGVELEGDKITKGNFIFGSNSGLAQALNGYVKDDAEARADVHVLLTEGIGNNLSDLLNNDANTYYIYSKVGFENFMALVNPAEGAEHNDFAGKTVKLSNDLSAELVQLEGRADRAEHTIYLQDFATKKVEEGKDDVYTWTPLGTTEKPFKGTFDGTIVGTENDHWVIDASQVTAFAGTENIGFFGAVAEGGVQHFDFKSFKIDNTAETADTLSSVGAVVGTLQSGTLKDITLSGIDFSGKLQSVGALVGTVVSGAVDTISVNGITIASTGSNVGGVVGAMQGGTLTTVTVGSNVSAEDKTTVSISGQSAVGGVVGNATGTAQIGQAEKAVNVWSNVTVKTTTKAASEIGGILGKADATVKVDNAHFEGKLDYDVAASETKTFKPYTNYGLVGTAGVEITNSTLHIVYSTGFELDAKWDAEHIVKAEYQVTEVAGLTFFTDVVNKGEFDFDKETVHLTTDLTLTDVDVTPIGTAAHPFKGAFTGEAETAGTAHTITGLTVKLHGDAEHPAHNAQGICENGKDYAGLFGYTDGGASIKYLTIDGAVVTAKEYAGVLVGRFNGTGTIEHVTVTNSEVRAHHFVGGIAAWTDGSIKNCEVNKVTAEAIPNVVVGKENMYDNGDDVGGLVGYVGKSTTTHTFESNKVIETTLTAYRDIGGLVGTDNAPTASVYKGNLVKDSFVTVIQLLYKVDTTDGNKEFYAGYPSDRVLQYFEEEKAKQQHADWLVGRVTTPIESIENERDNVIVTLFATDNVGFTYDNGVWHITDVSGFKRFAEYSAAETAKTDEYHTHFEGDTVVLENDLTLTKADVDELLTKKLLPIKGFAGSFNGNGYTLTFASDAEITGVGLFESLENGATVENLVIDGLKVSDAANANVGILAGTLNGATVKDITVNNATVTSTNGAAGGLFGTVDLAAENSVSNVNLNNVEVSGKTASAAFATFSGSGALTVDKFVFRGTLADGEGVTVTMLQGEGVIYKNSRVVLTDVVAAEGNKSFFYGANADEAGTAYNAAYFIEDEAGLKAFATLLATKDFAGETVYLLKDIALTEAWDAPESSTFAGTFEGLNHKIAAKEADKTAGYTLFAALGTTDKKATVKNLTLDGLALAANLNNANVDHVNVTIYVSGADMAYYGLAGAASETKDAVTITDSSVYVQCGDYVAKFNLNATVTLEADVDTKGNAYIVKTGAGLAYLATLVNSGFTFEGLIVLLNEDVTLADSWTPIGRLVKKTASNEIDEAKSKPFMGTFNGNGKTITGLTIDTLATDGTFGYGLFGYVKGGTITNLTIDGAKIDISGNDADYVGILAGALDTTTLTKVFIGKETESTVLGHYFVGAVAGYAKNVTLTTATEDYNVTVAKVTVKGIDDIGGVFGIADGTTGAIVAKLTDMYVGVDESKLNKPKDVGAAVGYVQSGTWDVTVDYTGQLVSKGAEAYHGMVGTVKEGATVNVLTGSKLTLLDEGLLATDYVTLITWTAGTEESVVVNTTVEIGTAAGLNHFRTLINEGNTYQGVTVLLTSETEYALGNIEALAAGKAFAGTLKPGTDASEKALNVTVTYMLTAADDAADYTVGFLSLLDGATVKNITFNAKITASKAKGVGGVAAKATNTTISDVTVNANISALDMIGGVVGDTQTKATITGCTVTGAMTVTGSKLGGIVGRLCGSESTVEGNFLGTKDKALTLTALAQSSANASDGYGMIGGIIGVTEATPDSAPADYVAVAVKDNTLVNVSIDVSKANKDNYTWQKYVGAIAANGNKDATYSNNSGDVAITVYENFALENLPFENGVIGPNAAKTYDNLEGNEIAVTWNGIKIDALGVWHLDTAADFDLFAELVNGGNDFDGVTVMLDDDIDLSGVVRDPVAVSSAFKGTFDGNGYTLTGFKAEVTTTVAYGGLFGSLENATVTNLTLKDFSVQGYTYVGALAGKAENSTIISNVKVVGGLFVGGTVGGIVGQNNSSSITDCTVDGEAVAASASAMGRRNAARVAAESGIYALTVAGGIVGEYAGDATFSGLVVENVNIQVTGTEKDAKAAAVGGIFGTVAEGASPTVEDILVMNVNLVYPEDMTAEDVKAGLLAGDATELGAAQVTAQGVKGYAEGAADKDKTDLAATADTTLEVYKNGEKPYNGILVAKAGGAVSYYLITSLEGFKALSTLVNDGTLSDATFKLDADIDLAGEAWTPIGNDAHRFMGTFDGRNHTISNVNVTGSQYVGLFGLVGSVFESTVKPVIKNIVFGGTNVVTVNATSYLKVRNDSGLLVGYAANTTFSNISFAKSSSVTVKAEGTTTVVGSLGGLVGGSQTNVYENIDATKATITIDAPVCSGAGGLIGMSMNDKVNSSDAEGDVLSTVKLGTVKVTAAVSAGGLIGTAYAVVTVSNVTIESATLMITQYVNWNDNTTGKAADTSKTIGGLVGSTVKGSSVTLSSCTVTGTLTNAAGKVAEPKLVGVDAVWFDAYSEGDTNVEIDATSTLNIAE